MTINGVAHSHDVEPRLLLVHFIRELAGLTGTHVGCDTTQCGACTVHLNGQAVKSCTILAVQADGQTVTTIEGLADGDRLDPVQEGFRVKHGLQCGYCTPGMIMSAKALLAENAHPSEAEIRQAIDGNLCGSLAHADPAGDPPAVAYALDAQFQVQGASGARTVAVDDWFVDTLQSALEPDEVLTEVRLAVPGARSGSAYRKFEQPASHYALVGVAAVVTLAEDGSVARCRVGVTGVGGVAYRAAGVESALTGQRPEAAALREAASHVVDGV